MFTPKADTATTDHAAMTVRQMRSLPAGSTVYVAAKLASGICYRVEEATKVAGATVWADDYSFTVDGRTIDLPIGRVYADPAAARSRCRASMERSIEKLQRLLGQLGE